MHQRLREVRRFKLEELDPEIAPGHPPEQLLSNSFHKAKEEEKAEGGSRQRKLVSGPAELVKGELCFSEKEFSLTSGALMRDSELSRNSLGKTVTLKEKEIEELLRLFAAQEQNRFQRHEASSSRSRINIGLRDSSEGRLSAQEGGKH